MLSRSAVRAYSSSAVKLVARDAPGNLSTLTVVVNNAGSKAGKAGVAHLLSKYNFLNNEVKSALRFTRESELLGGSFASTVTRDDIILSTQFLKQDLPYYVEALGNVLTKTSFRPHELSEIVLPAAKADFTTAAADNAFIALEELHQLSFRTGYGNPLYYDNTTKLSVADVQSFASQAYTSSGVSIFASGVNEADLAGFVGESAFSELPAGSLASPAVKTFTGKDARIRASGASSALTGVPVKPADFAKFETLSVAVGSTVLPNPFAPLASIPGATSHLYKYKDAGLFVVSVTGANGAVVSEGIKQAKKIVDGVTSSQLSSASKDAELALTLQSTFEAPLETAVSSVSEAKLGAFNYVAIGDVDALPYPEEL